MIYAIDKRALIALITTLTLALNGCGGGGGSTSALSNGTNDNPPPPTELGSLPMGIYSLDRVIDRPFVDGVTVRLSWSTTEPVEGQYDFSRIADIVRDAVAHGQSVTIANLMQKAPDWLLDQAQTYETDTEIPIPWDTVSLQAMARFAQAQANYEIDGIAIKDHPSIKQVSASINGINSLRVPSLPPDYTPDNLEQATIDSIQIWADAYDTGKHLYVGLFGVADDEPRGVTAAAIRDTLLERFDGTNTPRINFFQELLTGDDPSPGSIGFELLNQVQGYTGLMFQACGEWTHRDDSEWDHCWPENTSIDTPYDGFELGFTNIGATYFEIYPLDLENDAYYSHFEYWADVLRNL